MKRRNIVVVCLLSLLLFVAISSSTFASSMKTTQPSAARICNSTTQSIQSKYNSKYVSAELGMYQAPLRARATTVGPWEKFTLYPNSDGTCSLKSNANGLYVTAELGIMLAPLHARAKSIGSWEKYSIYPNSDGTWSLQAANNLWVSADIYSSNQPLIANANGSGYSDTHFYFSPA